MIERSLTLANVTILIYTIATKLLLFFFNMTHDGLPITLANDLLFITSTDSN